MRTAARKTVRPNADRKRRRRLAAMAERAAARERPFLGHGPRYLIHPSVSVACGPALSEIARDLRDQALPIDSEALDQLATLLTGPDSRLFEPSKAGALDAAVRLAHIRCRRKTTARIDLPKDEVTNVPMPGPRPPRLRTTTSQAKQVVLRDRRLQAAASPTTTQCLHAPATGRARVPGAA